jgi:para-aminobenzoate synthetase/4-amino-4-deoxychorismate lyase
MNAFPSILESLRTISPMAKPGSVWIRSKTAIEKFSDPVEVIAACSVADVWPALSHIEACVNQGLIAAGFVSYEAARAFDSALTVRDSSPIPLLWFGLYRECITGECTPSTASVHSLDWVPGVDHDIYAGVVGRIREYIAAGDTYQVNYTFPLCSNFSSADWLAGLFESQGTADQSVIFIDTGDLAVVSLSPEMFFSLDGNRLVTRPMKGTRTRGRFPGEDRALAEELSNSAKDRAENVMIVDMLRNDMGRISARGSVNVERMFDIERYDTVWQMTSTISSETAATVPEIFRALFPSGSVTGAPKVRTMQIIHELEAVPRGLYCGAIGTWRSARQAEFNVAIRTVVADRQTGSATYHIGSGITWDSKANLEYDECIAKAAVVLNPRPRFELIETLLFEPESGYFLLDRHLNRLQASARYFGFAFEREPLLRLLRTAADAEQPTRTMRVRLLLDEQRHARTEWAECPAPSTFSVSIANGPVNSNDIFLFHKTTNRAVYDRLRNAAMDSDDVILWNERGELTESTIGNLVIELDGKKVTPPIECGLLGGVMRSHLLDTDEIIERVITAADLSHATRIWLVNSVRGWIPCILRHAELNRK